MKSYKTDPRLASNINYIKNQQSDIFIQKGLNKPEIQYKHKRLIPKRNFISSYNLLEWNEASPHLNPAIKIKHTPNNVSQILNSKSTNFFSYDLNKFPGYSKKHKSFYEKMFENEPDIKINKSEIYLNARYQKETLDLGNYEGNEYKIKKNKSVIYDPSPYYKFKSPLNQKFDLIYNGCDDLIGNYKPAIKRNNKLIRSTSSFGFCKKEFETRNEYDPKIKNNPKKMKYFLFYGNRGLENANKKLKPTALSRSTNNVYVPGKEPSQNRIYFLRSNIFGDKEIDKMYNDDDKKLDNNNNLNNKTIKVNRNKNLRLKLLGKRAESANLFKNKNRNINNISNLSDISNNDIEIKDNYAKRFLYKNYENFPNKLDWRDPQCYLLFPQNKNSEILKKNARQRKFKEIFGVDPILPKEKLCQEFKSDERPEIDEIVKKNFNTINYSKMKRISENISQMQGNKFINENNNYNNKNINNNKLKSNDDDLTYELKTTKKKKLISNNELKKKFSKQGMHIYDLRENMGSVLNNKNNNTIEFKIRENNKDNNFDKKIKNLKKDFKDQGLVIEEKNKKKKGNTDLIPQDLNWDNPHLDLLTKNLNAVKSYHKKTHSKPPLNRKNNEDKITRIYVNLKYKTRPYNS